VKKCILPTLQIIASILIAQIALAQGDEMDRPATGCLINTLSENTQKFYFFPGGGYYGKHSPNAFTLTFCSYMEALLEDRFVLVSEPLSQHSVNNVAWGLWHGQKPLSNPRKNKKIRLAFDRIMSDTKGYDQINIISSSFGTALAAQLAIELVNYYKNAELLQPEINFVLGASMISKESLLFRELKKFQAKGLIKYVIYDELQDADDNVTGICGKSRLAAFYKALNATMVFGGNYMGQPSILNNHPNKGHIHLQRAQSTEKGKDFVRVTLIDYELAGPRVKARASEAQFNSEYPASIQP